VGGTSVWLCDFDTSVANSPLSTCTAYGTIPKNGYSFALVTAKDLTAGFNYSLEAQAGKNTKVRFYCDERYPKGHVGINNATDQTLLSADGNTLNIVARAWEVCARIIPTPGPMSGACTLDVWDDNKTRNYNLRLNLSDAQNPAPGSHGTWNVSMHRGDQFPRRTLRDGGFSTPRIRGRAARRDMTVMVMRTRRFGFVHSCNRTSALHMGYQRDLGLQ
jgi:hypothetical protein